ncbi:DUF481 domain-containing protein [Hahella ganghwensis]|uniref:DUF481 domain-containing protein n=1 Tax=Hahella ganghwensis TaxID=286420 RepID=UPI0003731C46|nr:DUF481 domain-containing protein [Hahella ganghwensis]
MRLLTAGLVIVVQAMSFQVLAQQGQWEGETELGVLVTSGNTKQTNVKGRLALKYDNAPWRNSIDARVIYTESDNSTTAEKYRAQLKTDYKYTERKYWFIQESYANERFSGYDFEVSATTGMGYRLWQYGERSVLDVSAGGGYKFSKLEEKQEETGSRNAHEAIARLAGQLDVELSDTALFRQKVSSEMGLEENDVVAESESSVQSQIMEGLSMKISFYVKHRSDPPFGAERTDTETSLSLLYTFL